MLLITGKHWWINKTLANHQSFFPQIYGIFDIHLPLLGHLPNSSPKSLNLPKLYPPSVFDCTWYEHAACKVRYTEFIGNGIKNVFLTFII